MQMSKTYESTSCTLRANQKRQDALECERAGFLMFAQVNWEEASLIDPPRYDEDLEQTRG